MFRVTGQFLAPHSPFVFAANIGCIARFERRGNAARTASIFCI